MHYVRNERLNGSNQNQGNIAAYFSHIHNLIQTNDGTRSFSMKTTDCYSQQAPFLANEETTIDITHKDHHVSNISDGFLTFTVELTLQLTGIDSQFDDNDNLMKLFVGWKSSNQILDKLQILCRNLDVGYQQNECTREGFAYSNIKTQQEKKTKKYTHSLYENVSNYSSSVCGTYINVNDFKDGQPHVVKFEVNLPFDDVLALGAFDLFPNAVVGDISLKMYTTPKGLVWCQINPVIIKEEKEVIQGEKVEVDTIKQNISTLFRHAYMQINNRAPIINKVTISDSNGIKVMDAESAECLLQCTGMRIVSLKSNMFGCKVRDSTIASIRNQLSKPAVIPSQQLDFYAFPIPASPTGIQTNLNIPLSNVTCISVMFPKYTNDFTIFENPMYNNVQLTVDGVNYPDQPINTYGARFLQQQLVASDLDQGLECTKEYEDSLIMDRNKPDGTRYVNTLRDGTSFMLNVQTERNGAGWCFDGLDSNGSNVQIEIKGTPVFSGSNDTYYNVNAEGTVHPSPPQLFLCRDTYFLISNEGMIYVRNGSPEGSQVNY